MKNKNLIIGGLVLVGLAGAYYFYNKNKGGGVASSAPASAGSPTMSGTSKPNKGVVDAGYGVKTNLFAPKWVVKRDIINGMKPDSTKGMGVIPPIQNILFRKGDIIQGEVEESYIFNKKTMGVRAFPTVKGAYFESVPVVLLEHLEKK